MAWSRFDDLYDDHPKVLAAMHASPLAVALHATAITAASRRESDGLVDPFWLLARVPEKRKRREALDTLVTLRLYDEIQAGDEYTRTDAAGYSVVLGPFPEVRYVVHDYLDYNPSSAQLQDRRRKDAERKAGGRRKDSDGNPPGVQPDISRTPDGPRGSAGADPRPSPSPIPSEAQQHLAATPQRSRAGGSSRSMAESVECPRCRVPAGEKCAGVRGPRESCHLERHHAVGELTHIAVKARGGGKPDLKAAPAFAPDPECEAIRVEHFPDTEPGTVESVVAYLRQKRQEPTVDAIRELIEGAAA